MTERAIVRHINNEIVTVACSQRESCESCSSSFCASSERTFDAINRNGIKINPGDIVDIYLAPGKAIGAGFRVLIVPLALFVGAYALSTLFIESSADGIRALFGLAGLALGFVLTVLHAKRKKNSQLPEIVGLSAKTQITAAENTL